MAATKLVLNITRDNAYDLALPAASKRREAIRELIALLRGILIGAKPASALFVMEGAVAASGTVTLANVTAADTVTINNVTFTAVASNPAANQFLQNGTDTQDAADLVRSINASATAGITGVVTAANVAGVVTITAVQPGLVGNAITLASSNGTRLAVSAARLANGSDGTKTTFI